MITNQNRTVTFFHDEEFAKLPKWAQIRVIHMQTVLHNKEQSIAQMTNTKRTRIQTAYVDHPSYFINDTVFSYDMGGVRSCITVALRQTHESEPYHLAVNGESTVHIEPQASNCFKVFMKG